MAPQTTTTTPATTAQPAAPVQPTAPAPLPNFSAMSPQQLTAGAVKYVQTQQQAGQPMAQIVSTLQSWGITLNADGSTSYSDPSQGSNAKPQVPSYGQDLKNIIPNIEGDVKDIGQQFSTANKGGFSSNTAAAEAGIDVAKDVIKVPADVLGGILGPILGLLPSVNPITNKIESLNKVMASPEYQQNTQNLQQQWSALTKNHPVVAKGITDSLSIFNNALQVYAAKSGVEDTSSFVKGVLDSGKPVSEGTPPGGGGGTPPTGTPDIETPEGGSSKIDKNSPSYLKGKSFGDALRNGKMPSFKDPLEVLKGKMASGQTTASKIASASLPNAEAVINESADAARARINDPGKAGSDLVRGTSLGKRFTEALSGKGGLFEKTGNEKSALMEKFGGNPLDIGPVIKSFEDKLKSVLHTTMNPTVFGSLEGKTFEESEAALKYAIDNQGIADQGGQIGKTPFNEVPGQKSLIKDPASQKLLGTVYNTLSGLSDGSTTVNQVASEIQNLEKSMDYDPTTRNTPAEAVVKGVIKDLKGLVNDAVPGYKDVQTRFSQLIEAQDALRESMSGVDKTTGKAKSGASLIDALFDKNQPLAGLQKLTGINASQEAAISRAFEQISNGEGKAGVLNSLRVSRSLPMFVMRTLQGLGEKYFGTPEALRAALLDIYQNRKP